MRITLTGRRLAVAAVLVLGGVAAPLAYATIADTKAPAATAAPAAPLTPVFAEFDPSAGSGRG